jgi:hypothetical protein
VGTKAFILALLVALTGCTLPPTVSHGCDGPASDHVMLVDRLRCAGMGAAVGERVTLPFLRPPGTQLLLSGGGVSGQAELQSFNYDDTDLGADGRVVSAADADKFAADGSLRDGSQRIYYRGTPHLFRQDRVLVIYAGDDPVVIAALTRLMGKQFAGG